MKTYVDLGKKGVANKQQRQWMDGLQDERIYATKNQMAVHDTSNRPKKMADREIHLMESTGQEGRQQIQEFFTRDPQGP